MIDHARPPQSEDVAVAAEVVGFPAVIKPVSGAASIGVMRVDTIEQLNEAYTRCAYKSVCVCCNQHHARGGHRAAE